MNQKKIIPIVTIIAIVAISIIVSLNINPEPKREINQQWISSGPFSISQSKYKLGENIFLSVHGLKPNEIGTIEITYPNGGIWVSIPFNGTVKSDFNWYYKPDTSAMKKIYSSDDLVGKWNVIFRGVAYEPLSFEIINEFMPGAEADIIAINPNRTQIIGPEKQQ